MYNPRGEPVLRGCETFLSAVPSFDDLPSAVQQAIRHRQSTDSIRQILFIPPQHYPQRHAVWRHEFTLGWRSTPPRTVVFSPEQVTIIEGLDAQTTWHIPLTDLLTIRLVTVLLHSYFELEWQDGAQTQTVQVEFNSVGMWRIERELSQVRAWIAKQSGSAGAVPPSAFSIGHFPLKYYNYTHLNLLPDELVWIGVYEPAIRTASRLLSRSLSPDRAIVITGQHLITVGGQCSDSDGPLITSYFTDCWFCPRARITRAAFETQSDVVWLILSLGADARAYRLPLREPHAAQLQTVLRGWLLTDRMYPEGWEKSTVKI